MCNYFIIAAVEISNSRTASAACTYCTAIGRKSSDSSLQMNGYKIGKHQGAKHFVMGNLQFSGKFNDRNAGSHTLVAASGVNHHRKLAAIHSGIGTGCCLGSGTDLNIVAVGVKKDFSDVCSIVSTKSLLRNGCIVTDLTLQNLLYIFCVNSVGKVDNVFYV